MSKYRRRVQAHPKSTADKVSDLADLRAVPLAAFPTAEVDEQQMARLMKRVDEPGTCISGFNGAGGYATGGYVDGSLTDVHRVALDELPDATGLEAGLRRVEAHLDKSGTSISGYNGAGGTADTSAVDVVELPDE